MTQPRPLSHLTWLEEEFAAFKAHPAVSDDRVAMLWCLRSLAIDARQPVQDQAP